MQKGMLRSSTVNFLGVVAVAYTLFIGWLSLIHMPQFMDKAPTNSDKVIHATAYFVMCSLWFLFLFFKGLKTKHRRTALWVAAIWSLFFGMVIEFLQLDFTTYRTGDYKDMIANTTGVLLSAICIFAFRQKLEKIKSEL